MKVKNQRKEVVYTGDLTMSVPERKTAITALDTVVAKVKAKEITLPPESIGVLEDLSRCLLALRPVDPAKDNKDTKK
jgi:hypothetical protein